MEKRELICLDQLKRQSMKVSAFFLGRLGELTGTVAEAVREAARTARAEGVTFADGETFQEKYDAGQLTGPAGKDGGAYAFEVNEEGRLILHYAGGQAPDFRLSREDGHLYLDIE